MTLSLHQKLAQRMLCAYGRLRRGMTLGVRAMLIKDGTLLLVRHTYMPGWYMPGGGVEKGESAAEGMVREIREEVGAALTGPAQLFGLYRHGQVDPRDHVALFVCRDFEQTERPRHLGFEIAEVRAFPLDALPPETTPATRARLREVLEGAPVSADW